MACHATAWRSAEVLGHLSFQREKNIQEAFKNNCKNNDAIYN